ncbi:hypothetical protein GCK32_022863 [Trichostrongylus colubriformis]|uniref:Uncharacterized protein n=1 Tax=Trichostrongylus colubriformis TaxID=6319 RepID=A0AAN8FYV9_TRICO
MCGLLKGDNRRPAQSGPMTAGRYAAREEERQNHGYPNNYIPPAKLVDSDSRMPLTVGQAAYGRSGNSKGPLTAGRAAAGFRNSRWD